MSWIKIILRVRQIMIRSHKIEIIITWFRHKAKIKNYFVFSKKKILISQKLNKNLFGMKILTKSKNYGEGLCESWVAKI